MKWDKPNGGVQRTVDKRYLIVRATQEPEIWIAYVISQFTATGEELGVKSSAEDAREVCEDYERDMAALRKRA